MTRTRPAPKQANQTSGGLHIFTELLGGLDLPDITAIDGKVPAFSYLRVSTTAQADTDYDPDGFSIKAQREANQRAADDRNAVIVAEFVDRGESAKTADPAQPASHAGAAGRATQHQVRLRPQG